MSNHQQSLIAALQARFVARTDRWVVQDRAGRYRACRGRLSSSLIAAHLAGTTSLCAYCLAPQASGEPRALWGAFDLDAQDTDDGDPDLLRPELVSLARALAAALAALVGPEPVIGEATGGRGLHVWLLLAEPVPASRLTAVMNRALIATGVAPGARSTGGDGIAVERFPKQTRLAPGGVGTALRLPLGVHPRSGRRSALLDLATGAERDPYSALIEPATRLPVADVLARVDLDEHPARPASPLLAESQPAPQRTRRCPFRERPVRPDAWLTYRWAVTQLGLSDRTTCPPQPGTAGRGHPVRCLFPAFHAHGDQGAGSAYLISRGDVQIYGCTVCEGGLAIDTIALVRRVRADLAFTDVLVASHAIDPVRC